MSDTITISVMEIQKQFGLSRNQVKSVMKKHNIYHDGSADMRYPLSDAFDVLRKERTTNDAITQKRAAISEQRKVAKENKSADVTTLSEQELAKIFDVTPTELGSIRKKFGLRDRPFKKDTLVKLRDNGKVDEINEFISKLRLMKSETSKVRREKDKRTYITQAEICELLGIDRFDIKAAITSELIVPGENKKFLREDIENIDVTNFSEKLKWERRYPTTNAAKLLDISNAVFLRLVEKHNVTPIDSYKSVNYNSLVKLWRYGDFAFLIDSKDVNESIQLSEKIKVSREKNQASREQRINEVESAIRDNVSVGVRDRQDAPEYVAFHLGPTNSGKTYNALENLSEEYEKNPFGTYVYSGPLRMLAFEVYEKLSERFGSENVGFITGEEQINPNAPILATTVEMAPTEGDLLIIDEAHWVVDDDRGHYWTKLLIGAKYQRIHIIAAREVKEDLMPLVEDAHVIESFEYERRTPILYSGALALKDVPAKTAVVCFSRRSVYAMASALRSTGKKVGVLYGALPLKARKEQIQLFIGGKFDIIVTTDVIGHGINLPIDNVVFAESEKFDGKIRRNLHTWEAGQIAGRAGRYGLSDKGRVYTLTGRDWFTKDADLIKRGVYVAGGKIPSDLVVDKPLVAPRLGDLGLSANEQMHLNYAIDAWKEKATDVLKHRSIKPSELATIQKNLASVAETLDCYLNYRDIGGKAYDPETRRMSLINRNEQWVLPVDQLWQVVAGPFDANSPALSAVAMWLNQGQRKDSHYLQNCYSEYIEGNLMGDLMVLEAIAKINGELKMIALMFADERKKLGVLSISKLDVADEAINNRIIKLLKEAIMENEFGTCLRCSKECPPWFDFCDVCHSSW